MMRSLMSAGSSSNEIGSKRRKPTLPTIHEAASSAKLGLPEVGLAIIPGYGGTQRLQRLVGRGSALEWILTGEPYTAEEAYRIGVVNRVFPPETRGESMAGCAAHIESASAVER